MRALHVIPSLDPQDGGPSVALPLMARSLAHEGMEVDVVATMTAEDAASQGVKFGEPLPRDGFTVRFFERQTRFYKVSLPMRAWLRANAHRYQIVHVHALFSFASLSGASAARRAGVPYIMRPLGLLNAWGMTNRRRRIKAVSFRLFDRRALDHAAVIHYTSAQEQNEAARLRLKSPTVVIPLGIDLHPFDTLPSAEVFLESYPQARGRELVLFLSRIDPKKGLDVLLPAFAKLRKSRPQALLVVAGQGDPAYLASLHALASSLAIQEDVVWTGRLEGALKLAAFAAARIFVLPSYSENFGIALLEAMAAGLPCVSTEGVALAREAAAADAVLLTPSDPAHLHEMMRTLLGDEGMRQRCGAHAAALARNRYSLKAMGVALAGLYQRILSS